MSAVQASLVLKDYAAKSHEPQRIEVSLKIDTNGLTVTDTGRLATMDRGRWWTSGGLWLPSRRGGASERLAW